jgi:hypothetical protein
MLLLFNFLLLCFTWMLSVLNKLSLQPQKVLPLLFVLFAVEFCSSDPYATWSLQCLVLLSGFVTCVLAVLVIPSVIFIIRSKWCFFVVSFCVLLYANCAVDNSCTQLSWFYWHSVSSTFQPSGSFVHSAHLSVGGAVNILWFILSSLWAFPKLACKQLVSCQW